MHADAVWLGRPSPLGATFDGHGTNFALFSDIAERVELCLFDEGASQSERRVPLFRGTGNVFHAYLPEVVAGQRYGFRVHGPWDPEQGLHCNPNKLLADPYARELSGAPVWHPSFRGHSEEG
jgi:glycogen operon protein